jgi:hypothetical protein
MMVVLVDQNSLCLIALQTFGHFEPAESTADDNNPGFSQISDTRMRGYQFLHESTNDLEKTVAKLTG